MQRSFLNGSKCCRDSKDKGHQGTPNSKYQKFGRDCTGREMAGKEEKGLASFSHDAHNHKPKPPKHQEPQEGCTGERRQKAPNTERKETRQANPTPPQGMKGGEEEGGRAGMKVGLIETQSTVNNEPRSLARMQTAGTPPLGTYAQGMH